MNIFTNKKNVSLNLNTTDVNDIILNKSTKLDNISVDKYLNSNIISNIENPLLLNNTDYKEVDYKNIYSNYRSESKSWITNNADKYENIFQVGEGTYGKVFKAKIKNIEETKYVALKCILMDKEKEGFPITALREIMILKNLKHQNLINMLEIVSTKEKDKNINNIYLVFEYMNHDLAGLLKSKINFKLPTIKSIFYQSLLGVNHLHLNNILHRDIKSANILVSSFGEIKVGDFGLARRINPFILKEKNMFTNKVVTLWYRAPEILLGSKNYSFVSDVWSLGCMFLEIILGECPFRGMNEKSQIINIFEKCGTPIDNNSQYKNQLNSLAINESNINNSNTIKNEYWPNVTKYELYNYFIGNKYFPSVFEKLYKDKW